MSRISRDEMFIRIAQVVAMRSTCDRANVGAVLVKDNRVISIGYNGSKPGEPHCDEVGHLMENGHCVRTLHAESNAIDFATKMYPGGIKGLTIYCTHFPCMGCVITIIQDKFTYDLLGKGVSIERLVYLHDYGDGIKGRISMLEGQGIKVEQFRGNLAELPSGELQELPTE